jgi:hypothetical protein
MAEMGEGEQAPVAAVRHLSEAREARFPNLRRDDYRVTSDEDWIYNCIAHAADKSNAFWWPTKEEVEGVYWPKDVPREKTLEAFIAAYATEHYAPCEGPEYEEGHEKVVIYTDAAGIPTHAAKLLAPGTWTSKLGEWEDIQHKSLEAVSGPDYGEPKAYLKRKVDRPTQGAPDQPSKSSGSTDATPPADSVGSTDGEGKPAEK